MGRPPQGAAPIHLGGRAWASTSKASAIVILLVGLNGPPDPTKIAAGRRTARDYSASSAFSIAASP
jgi:hypothetical protein